MHITPENKYVLKCILFSFLPVLIVGVISGKVNPLQDVAIILISTFSFAIQFSIKGNRRIFITILSLIFSVLIVSALITLIVGYPDKYQHLLKYEIPIRSRSDFTSIEIYYPFSTIYSFFWTELFVFPRFNLYFIEAGITSGFLAALFAIHILRNNSIYKYIILAVLILGGFLTFSTSFVPAFGIAMLVNYISKSTLTVPKVIVITALGIIVFWLFSHIPYIGLNDKSQTHGSSFDDRVDYYAFSTKNINQYVTLVSSILMIYFIQKRKKHNLIFLSFFAPIFFTGLINVVFFSPLYIAFSFLDMGVIQVNKSKPVFELY
ncbi:hypothetical protein D3C79_768510 [compost metagenome]